MNRIDQLSGYLKDAPEDAFLIHALALEYVKDQQYENAENYFLQNIKFNPDYLATYYHLAKLYESRKSYNEAIQYYQSGIELAKRIGDRKTLGELTLALNILEDDIS